MEISKLRKIVELMCVSGFGVLPSPTSDQVQIFNDVDAPIVGVFLDHPFCLHDRIDMPTKNYCATFPSGHAGAFCERCIRPDEAFHNLPHDSVERATKPWLELDIDLLLTGSLFRPLKTQRAAWKNHGADVEGILNDIVDLVRLDLVLPVDKSVCKVLGGDAEFACIVGPRTLILFE